MMMRHCHAIRRVVRSRRANAYLASRLSLFFHGFPPQRIFRPTLEQVADGLFPPKRTLMRVPRRFGVGRGVDRRDTSVMVSGMAFI
jgi:hypothetical protein